MLTGRKAEGGEAPTIAPQLPNVRPGRGASWGRDLDGAMASAVRHAKEEGVEKYVVDISGRWADWRVVDTPPPNGGYHAFPPDGSMWSGRYVPAKPDTKPEDTEAQGTGKTALSFGGPRASSAP